MSMFARQNHEPPASSPESLLNAPTLSLSTSNQTHHVKCFSLDTTKKEGLSFTLNHSNRGSRIGPFHPRQGNTGDCVLYTLPNGHAPLDAIASLPNNPFENNPLYLVAIRKSITACFQALWASIKELKDAVKNNNEHDNLVPAFLNVATSAFETISSHGSIPTSPTISMRPLLITEAALRERILNIESGREPPIQVIVIGDRYNTYLRAEEGQTQINEDNVLDGHALLIVGYNSATGKVRCLNSGWGRQNLGQEEISFDDLIAYLRASSKVPLKTGNSINARQIFSHRFSGIVCFLQAGPNVPLVKRQTEMEPREAFMVFEPPLHPRRYSPFLIDRTVSSNFGSITFGGGLTLEGPRSSDGSTSDGSRSLIQPDRFKGKLSYVFGISGQFPNGSYSIIILGPTQARKSTTGTSINYYPFNFSHITSHNCSTTSSLTATIPFKIPKCDKHGNRGHLNRSIGISYSTHTEPIDPYDVLPNLKGRKFNLSGEAFNIQFNGPTIVGISVQTIKSGGLKLNGVDIGKKISLYGEWGASSTNKSLRFRVEFEKDNRNKLRIGATCSLNFTF